MTSRLKNLYKYLVENRKHQLEGWHNSYSDFSSKVFSMRQRLSVGEDFNEIASSDEGTLFLKRLIYDDNNGVAARGQSTLSKENFNNYIKDLDFLTSLGIFIEDPNESSFESFTASWKNTALKYGANNNPLLINRVAAACTINVSTTVDTGKFNQVFSWMERENLIPMYPEDGEQGWFSKNKFLMSHIHKEFKVEMAPPRRTTDEYYLSQFIWELYVNLANPFSLKKQIIKYGAPGTGKTYQARQQTSLLFDIWKEEFAPQSNYTHASQIELTQFHPSYSYEDFMEGLRPVLDENSVAQLTLQNGVFKEFCRRAGKWEIDVFKLGEKFTQENGREKEWEEISIEELVVYKDRLAGNHWDHIFNAKDLSKLVAAAIPPFFFIIDEINRAELSRVFGELMYCLEYRGIKGRVKTQYSNLNNENVGMLHEDQGYSFFIPSNIYLIGTMNTIDRSVESFDFALRRRFSWEEVTPDSGILKYHLNQSQKAWIALADNLEHLNEQIAREPLLGDDYKIGHAYLMDLKYSSSLTIAEVRSRIWDDSIRPLLQEYSRGTGREKELIGAFGKAFGV